MSRSLIATKPRVAEILEVELRKINPDEVLIRVDYASPKHGTEMTDFRGKSPWDKHRFDEKSRLFVPRESQESGIAFGSWNVGNMVVGHIINVGSDVKSYAVGERVATYGGISEYIIAKGVDNHRLRKMKETDIWQNAVCYDPMQYALSGIRDAHVRPGDEVVIFGLGAIGLLAVAIAKNIGAKVYAVDPLENRRNIALSYGADHALDPIGNDIGSIIKSSSHNQGADSAIETSGNPHALQQALRSLAYGGIVAYVAFPKEFTGGLDFGKESHFNNLSIVFSRASNEPNRDYPRWNRKRIEDTCWEMLMLNQVNCEKMITPVVSFEESAEAYMKYVDQEPELSVKLGIDFTGDQR